MGTRNCKSCKSERAEWINAELKRGATDIWVANALADMGISISHTSIMRHRSNCLGITKRPPKTAPKRAVKLSEPPDADSPTLTANPLAIDVQGVIAAARQRAGGDTHLVSHLLREIALDQIAVVKVRQGDYLSGTGQNPIEDVKVLQAVHSILKEEAVIAHLEIDPDAPVDEKAKRIAHGVIEGKISPANAERLLGVLHRQMELTEYQSLFDEVERLTQELTGDED